MKKNTLLFAIAILLARLAFWFVDSRTNGRLTIPPGYDDIAYYATALEDTIALKNGSTSIINILSSSRHSPFLNLIAVFSYLLHLPTISTVESLGTWVSFYLPNITLYLSVSSLVLAWAYFTFRSFGLPVLLPLFIFSVSSFSWYAGLASEFRPDIPASLILALSILGFFINVHNRRIKTWQLGAYLSLANICCYIKPSTFPLTIATTLAACLVYIYLSINTSRGVRNSFIRAAKAFSFSSLILIPFALTTGQSALAYIIKSQITAASIWHGHYDSFMEKWLWYITGPGKDLVNPYHPIVLITLPALLCLVFAKTPLLDKLQTEQQASPIRDSVSIVSCTFVSFLPYIFLASQSNHKSIFLGSFIGISLGVIFSFVLSIFVLACLTPPRLKRQTTCAIIILGVVTSFWLNNYTFETTFWGPSYNRANIKQRIEHNRVVNQIVLLSQKTCESTFVDKSCRIYLGVTSYINRDLLYSYLLSSLGPGTRLSVDAPGELMDVAEHQKLIDNANIIIFSSPQLPGTNKRFGFYLPGVQRAFQLKQTYSDQYTLEKIYVHDNNNSPHAINLLLKRSDLH